MTILCNRTHSNFLNCKTMEKNKNLNFRSLARSRFHHSNTLVYLTRLLRPPKCIWGADCNWRWWGHLMTILCNRTRSNFLNCKMMENQKLKFSLARSLTEQATWWNFHYLIFVLAFINLLVFSIHMVVLSFFCHYYSLIFSLYDVSKQFLWCPLLWCPFVVSLRWCHFLWASFLVHVVSLRTPQEDITVVSLMMSLPVHKQAP